MPVSFYITLGIYLLGCICGVAGSSYVWDLKVKHLEATITSTSLEQKEIYLQQVALTQQQEQRAIAKNTELETAHAQSIETINSLHDKLVAVQLQPNSTSTNNCSSSKGTSNNTKIPVASSETDEFPTRLHQFLIPRTQDSDLNTNYALECYKFVVENNCGLSK